jgi:hypothetical protein
MTQTEPGEIKNRYQTIRHAVQRSARDAGRGRYQDLWTDRD